MIKHIVMFQLKGTEEEKKAVAEKFCEALMALPGQIDCLRSTEAAPNINPAEKWDVALIAVVDNMEDLKTYAEHPLHQAAVSLIKDHKADRACVDFEF